MSLSKNEFINQKLAGIYNAPIPYKTTEILSFIDALHNQSCSVRFRLTQSKTKTVTPENYDFTENSFFYHKLHGSKK